PRPGIAAARILGLGRALGEAIAVAQVIGAGWTIPTSLFKPGDTLASKIVEEFQGYSTKLQLSSLFYLGAILLVIGLVTNLFAQLIARRFDVYRIAEAIAILAAAVAVAMLVWVVWSVAERGASLISWSFLTGDLPIPFSPEVGGIGPLIVGSAIVVGIATAIALPVGVLIALFLEEFASNWLRVPIQLAIDLMTGLPSIIIAIFVFSALRSE